MEKDSLRPVKFSPDMYADAKILDILGKSREEIEPKFPNWVWRANND